MVIILIAISCLVSCVSYSSPSQTGSSIAKGQLHKVIRGETLASIASRYGLSYKDLARINGIGPPYIIYPGQQLRFTSDGRVITESMDGNLQTDLSNSSKKRTKKSEVSPKKTYAGGTLKWQWPAGGKIIASFQGESGLNKGIDLGGKLGEPVLAAASGQVIYAGSGLSGYGNLLIIKHSEIFLSAYAHNNQLLVKEGDIVKAGQKIADMGSSGTDRVKLHFEIRSEGNPVDPLKFLPKR